MSMAHSKVHTQTDSWREKNSWQMTSTRSPNQDGLRRGHHQGSRSWFVSVTPSPAPTEMEL